MSFLKKIKQSIISIVIITVFISCCLFYGIKEVSAATDNIPQVTIRVSGAWALYPMMVKWGEEFWKIHPNMRIDISA